MDLETIVTQHTEEIGELKTQVALLVEREKNIANSANNLILKIDEFTKTFFAQAITLKTLDNKLDQTGISLNAKLDKISLTQDSNLKTLTERVEKIENKKGLFVQLAEKTNSSSKLINILTVIAVFSTIGILYGFHKEDLANKIQEKGQIIKNYSP